MGDPITLWARGTYRWMEIYSVAEKYEATYKDMRDAVHIYFTIANIYDKPHSRKKGAKKVTLKIEYVLQTVRTPITWRAITKFSTLKVCHVRRNRLRCGRCCYAYQVACYIFDIADEKGWSTTLDYYNIFSMAHRRMSCEYFSFLTRLVLILQEHVQRDPSQERRRARACEADRIGVSLTTGGTGAYDQLTSRYFNSCYPRDFCRR